MSTTRRKIARRKRIHGEHQRYAPHLAPLLCVDDRRRIVRFMLEQMKDEFPDATFLVGTGVSGIAAASMLGYRMDLPVLVVRKLTNEDGHCHSTIEVEGHPYEYLPPLPGYGVWVDDLIDSGRTERRVLEACREARVPVGGRLMYKVWDQTTRYDHSLLDPRGGTPPVGHQLDPQARAYRAICKVFSNLVFEGTPTILTAPDTVVVGDRTIPAPTTTIE